MVNMEFYDFPIDCFFFIPTDELHHFSEGYQSLFTVLNYVTISYQLVDFVHQQYQNGCIHFYAMFAMVYPLVI